MHVSESRISQIRTRALKRLRELVERLRRGPRGMKRSTWVAVLVTAAVLVVAGNLPRLPLGGRSPSTWRAGRRAARGRAGRTAP